MTSPVYGKSYDARSSQRHKVAKRWRLHGPVWSTFPAYDVTCQPTYFRRVAELPVFRGDDIRWFWFREGNTSLRAFHYLYAQNTGCSWNVPVHYVDIFKMKFYQPIIRLTRPK